MLTCQGCMRHCLQTLIGDSASLSSPIRTSIVTRDGTFKRRYSAQPQRAILDENENDSYMTTKLRTPRPRHYSSSQTPYKGSNTVNPRQQWLASRGTTPAHKRRLEPANMRQHLKYLKDPLKLADDIRRMLREDDAETALETVRAASKDVQCTVSWNHLIDWYMSKGRMTAAVKLYNEMKKRAQVPDTYTYTMLFRGFAEHEDTKSALAKGMAVYYAMLAPNSPVRPTVIHLNAVLKLCARAQDMDALFAIAGDMPRDGMRAPDNWTFTIIFNAMRFHAIGDLRGDLTPMQKRQNLEKVLLNARKMWLDIKERWRSGDLKVDEELVCGMGRILLTGNETDADDIFSLVEQTMNIPRQLPRISTPSRDKIEKADRNKQAEVVRGVTSQGDSLEESHMSETQLEPTLAATDVFSPPLVPAKKTITYARPGRNVLSLVMQAMLVMRLKGPATKYWEIFTIKHKIFPDPDNYAAYLRILRVARASSEAVEILRQMPPDNLQVKHFRIAISACVRDKLNRNCFANAGKVLDLMQQHMEKPDLDVLQTYLEVAISAPAFAGKNSDTESKYALGQQILRALHRLDPSIYNIKSMMNYGENAIYNRSLKPRRDTKDDQMNYERSLRLWRKMIAAYDLCMNKALVERNMYTELSKHRSKLAAWETRYQQHLKNVSKPERRLSIQSGDSGLPSDSEVSHAVE